MNPPLVSIIIPCYNAIDFIEEAVQSALNQTYPRKEIIVVDDGSTDGSLSLIWNFGNKIRWETGPNRGGGAARNVGLKMARGDFVQFLDADDLLDSNKLEMDVNALQTTQAELVYSGWRQFCIETPDLVTNYSVSSRSNDTIIIALQWQHISTNSALINKDALLAIDGFREDLPCCQDRDLYIRLACSCSKFTHIRKTLHTVRRRKTSVSRNELQVRVVLYQLLVNLYQELAMTGRLNNARKEAFAGLVAGGARRLVLLQNIDIAKEHFSTAFRMHPSGGLGTAYGRSYLFARLLGPILTDKLINSVRRFLRQSTRSY